MNKRDLILEASRDVTKEEVDSISIDDLCDNVDQPLTYDLLYGRWSQVMMAFRESGDVVKEETATAIYYLLSRIRLAWYRSTRNMPSTKSSS